MPASLLRALAALAFAAVCGTAAAHDFKAGNLVIYHPWATPTAPGARTGATYIRSIENTGKTADALIGARTPVAGSVELHTMKMDGNVMRMREVDAIALPPGATIELDRGALHLMLIGLKKPLKVGEGFPMVLKFRNAGELEVHVRVQANKPAGPGMGQGPDHEHMQRQH